MSDSKKPDIMNQIKYAVSLEQTNREEAPIHMNPSYGLLPDELKKCKPRKLDSSPNRMMTRIITPEAVQHVR
jgi:hypothetical protein